jgi:hypothetical protein
MELWKNHHIYILKEIRVIEVVELIEPLIPSIVSTRTSPL